MLDILKTLVLAIRDLFRRRTEIEIEITILRHQLAALRRKSPARIQITRLDRLFLTFLYRIQPDLLHAIYIVKTETVVRWHRMGFRSLWRWNSRPRGGRPKVSKEIRDLIREMSRANLLWGAPRIHGELKMPGFDVARSTVAKCMIKRHGPSLQGWKAFLRNHAEGIAACDFLVVPTVGLRLLYAFVVLGHGRRRLLHVAVTDRPTAEWTARQIVEAFPWDAAPEQLIRDNDSIYGVVFRERLAAMNIRDGPTAVRSPWQNGYAERFIGSIRRECLDHMIIVNAVHLRRVLKAYAKYYNEKRTHLSLNKDAPLSRQIYRSGHITATPHLGELHHEYGRIE